jgi:hypothetical protein
VPISLAAGVALLVVFALLGAFDVFAVGAVIGFWALCAASALILGRPGDDWIPPIGYADLRRHLTVTRRGALARLRGLTLSGGAARQRRPGRSPRPVTSDGTAGRRRRGIVRLPGSLAGLRSGAVPAARRLGADRDRPAARR